MRLLIERLTSSAKLPTRAYEHDAGLDLYSDEECVIKPGERAIIRTGIKLAIPSGCAGLVWDKGGMAKNGLHSIAGVIDAGFRGELTIHLHNIGDTVKSISLGQKVAQLLIQKVEFPAIIETKIEDETERGERRFGSSGL
jgi:dUTP pyrophosphatase